MQIKPGSPSIFWHRNVSGNNFFQTDYWIDGQRPLDRSSNTWSLQSRVGQRIVLALRFKTYFSDTRAIGVGDYAALNLHTHTHTHTRTNTHTHTHTRTHTHTHTHTLVCMYVCVCVSLCVCVCVCVCVYIYIYIYITWTYKISFCKNNSVQHKYCLILINNQLDAQFLIYIYIYLFI